MQKILIIGNSNYARLVREYVDDLAFVWGGIKCIGFSVDGAYISDSTLDGLPVIAFEEISRSIPADSVKLVLAIGYQKLMKTRKDIYTRYSGLGYEFTNYIHPSAQIDSTAAIGNGNIFFEGVIVQKHARIGCGNLFWHRAMISHNDTVGDFNTFCANALLCGFVKVGDCAFFGSGAIVKDNVEIVGNNLVAAGAYVNRNIRENQAVIPPSSEYIKDYADLLAMSL